MNFYFIYNKATKTLILDAAKPKRKHHGSDKSFQMAMLGWEQRLQMVVSDSYDAKLKKDQRIAQKDIIKSEIVSSNI